MKTLNIGLVGTGVVGQGVIELLQKNGSLLSKRSGVRFVLKAVSSRSIFKKKCLCPKGY